MAVQPAGTRAPVGTLVMDAKGPGFVENPRATRSKHFAAVVMVTPHQTEFRAAPARKPRPPKHWS